LAVAAEVGIAGAHRLGAVSRRPRYGDRRHRREQRGQPAAYHRMIVGEDDADWVARHLAVRAVLADMRGTSPLVSTSRLQALGYISPGLDDDLLAERERARDERLVRPVPVPAPEEEQARPELRLL